MPVAVSLVIPLYNEERTVDRLLQSVLAQTRRPDEVVCVDAGSTDTTAERASRYGAHLPLRVLRLGRLNPGEARNAGVTEATFDWLAFTDGGITLDCCWLERLLKEIGGGAEAVFGSYEPVCDTRFRRWAALAYVPPRGPQGIRGPSVVSMVVSRRAFGATGGFPPSRASEDLVFLERLLESTAVAYSRESVVHWEIAGTPAATFRRFSAYSYANLTAGRGRFWHRGLYRQYGVAGAGMVLAGAAVGWWAALGLLGGWFLARAIKACIVKRGHLPFAPLRVDNVLGCAFVLAIIDAATITGSLRWLLTGAEKPRG